MLTYATGQVILFAGLVLTAVPATPPAQVTSDLDAVLEGKWKDEKITPASTADDATFLRRVYLDLTGQVPPVEKVQAFLADKKPDKRRRLVDELLAGDAFAEHWARTWAIRLTDRRPVPQDTHDGKVLQEFLRDAIKTNKPYPRVVREILTGDGLADSSGAANFYLRYNADSLQLAGAVGQQFMGVSLQCAQCHDHVFAKWKQDDFWGLAAVFARLKKLNAEDGTVSGVLEARRGELERPDPKGKPDEMGKLPTLLVKPKLPGGKEAVKGNRRAALADWLTADDNPYLARHYVNQTWKQLFGARLMPNLDNLDAIATSRHGQILELLAADFKAGGYDLKRLVRVVVLSRAYQLSSKGGQGSADNVKLANLQTEHFARFRTRPLSVDQLYASIVGATGWTAPAPPAAEGQPAPDAKPPEPPDDPEVDPADKPVDALGPNALTVQRALVLLNGDFINQTVIAGAERATKKKGEKIGAAHVEYLFLATLSRKPDAAERTAMLKLLEGEDKNMGLQDVVWALLNSAEFSSNH
jgi:hypothetical protein